MKREEIRKDFKFYDKCLKYGLDWPNYKVCYFAEDDYVIYFEDSSKNMITLLDKNYNIFCISNNKDLSQTIESKTFGINPETYAFIQKKYQEYCELTFVGFAYKYGISPSSYHPFSTFSLKDIMDLSVHTLFLADDKNSKMLVDRKLVCGKEDENYIGMLCYVNFLKSLIEEFHINEYHFKSLGFDYPNIYFYLRNMIRNIDTCTLPEDLLKYLGKYDREAVANYRALLSKIINTISEENKGAKISRETVPSNVAKDIDLSLMSQELLKILDEEEKKTVSASKAYEIERINLSSWLKTKTRRKTKYFK